MGNTQVMNVFLSWSGERSKMVASALKVWMPDVLVYVKAWASAHDIDAGVRWNHELTKLLSKSSIGIIIVTPENQNAPWLMFEAGALSKSLEHSRVIPLLVGLKPSDLETPLSQFQCVESNKVGFEKIIDCLNNLSDEPLPSDRVKRILDNWWHSLEPKLDEAKKYQFDNKVIRKRSDRDVLNEVLNLVRSITRSNDREKGYLHPLDDRFIATKIDSREIFGDNGELVDWPIPSNYNISQFLDEVFYLLNKQNLISPYKYGEQWLLLNTRTEELFDYIGIEYCRSKGSIVDHVLISELDIEDGDTLKVVSPEQLV